MTRVRLVAAAVALMLVVAACSDTPVAPQMKPSFSRLPSSELLKLARYRTGPPRHETFVSQTVGPTGGSLFLAGFEVVLPPGAVSKPTTLSITLPTDQGMAAFVWASFTPHGMHFNVPVTLRVPYQGTTSDLNDGSHVMWFDGTQWVGLQTTKTADGRLETKTKHFSDYGTETPDTVGRGIVITGN